MRLLLPQPAAAAEPPPHHPGVVSKKIVVPKAKTKILMRTSTERVVTPEITDRILKGLREEKPAAPRAFTPPQDSSGRKSRRNRK